MRNLGWLALAWIAAGILIGVVMGAARSLGGKREVLGVLKQIGRRVGLVVVASVLLGGCITNAYTRAHEARLQDAAFMATYNACGAETAVFGLIPDFGATRDITFFRCMEKAGWVQPPRWNRTPAALGFYERIQ